MVPLVSRKFRALAKQAAQGGLHVPPFRQPFPVQAVLLWGCLYLPLTLQLLQNRVQFCLCLVAIATARGPVHLTPARAARRALRSSLAALALPVGRMNARSTFAICCCSRVMSAAAVSSVSSRSSSALIRRVRFERRRLTNAISSITRAEGIRVPNSSVIPSTVAFSREMRPVWLPRPRVIRSISWRSRAFSAPARWKARLGGTELQRWGKSLAG